MVWFRENWYEEVLRQLRAGLAKCHVVAFHNRSAVADATVTPHTLNFIKKVVSTFGIGIGISKFSTAYVCLLQTLGSCLERSYACLHQILNSCFSFERTYRCQFFIA